MEDGLDRGRLRFVEAGGIATRVYEAGEGESLVLIHGGGFGSLYSLDGWSLNLRRLAARFRVIAFDKLGQGHTGNPEDDSRYTFGRLLAHAVALLERLELGPAHLVGHSMGALLAARIALERPELARTLVIVDSNTVAPDDPRFPWTRFYAELDAKIPPGPPTRETVRIEPDLQSFSTEHVTDDFLERLLEIARRPEFEHASRRIRELRRDDVDAVDPAGARPHPRGDRRARPAAADAGRVGRERPVGAAAARARAPRADRGADAGGRPARARARRSLLLPRAAARRSSAP